MGRLTAAFSLAIAVIAVALVPGLPANATGTAVVQQHDGSIKVYKNVRISIGNESMMLTSADGVGTLVIGKAACSRIDELVRCLPYDATLHQYGETTHIRLSSGTVWLNPTQTKQTLSHSSAQLPPRGVLMSVHTHGGTYVSLSGIVDEVYK